MRKPNLHGKVARAAISAALTGVMTMSGVVAPAATAFANQITLETKKSETASVTSDETTYKYYAVKVFNAGDVDPDTFVVTDPTWTSDSAIKSAVIKYINDKNFAGWLSDKGLTGDTAAQSAANALNFISEKITEDEVNGASYNHSNSGNVNIANYKAHITAGDSFANGLAKAIAETIFTISKDPGHTVAELTEIKTTNDASLYVTANSGMYAESSQSGIITLKEDSDGFYVLVPSLWFSRTDAGEVTTSFKNRAPIWVPYTGTANLQISIKDYVGTVTKLVTDDATGSKPGSVADAAKDQPLDFEITVTMPKAVSGLSELFVDDLMPEGMTYKAGSAKISVKGGAADTLADPTDQSVTEEDGTTNTYKRWDIKSSASGLEEGEAVVITYQAALNQMATTGIANYNSNQALLRYKTTETGAVEEKTVVSTTNVTAYKLVLNLIDSLSKDAIKGTNAKFTIQEKGGQYINANGEMSGTPVELDFGTASSLSIPYIDEGVFIVTQTSAPDGYELTSSNVAEITITADKKQGKVVKLSATSNDEKIAEVVSIIDGSGAININIPNIAKDTIVLPITGMTPSQLGTLVGALFLVAAAALYVVRRRGAENA